MSDHGLLEGVKRRAQASAYRVGSKLVAYICLFLTAVFIVAGIFVWLAREESLLFACLVFAGIFFVIAIVCLVAALVFGRSARRYQTESSQQLMQLLRNPTVAAMGLRAVGNMRRAPGAVLATALAVGIALSFMNRANAKQRG